ncbi:MAG: DUF262 domain-containing protein, partial [Chloroflexota bacterium]|nr:DUF262 domain-containing protein [Chloroflexota bacterium]
MKADETRLGGVLGGPRQYVVPYFQRAYSWGRQQWNTLLDDILELYESGSPHGHFLGSIVLLAENGAFPGPGDGGGRPLTQPRGIGSSPRKGTRGGSAGQTGGPAPTLLIDGQQRLVTLCLFLCAVRDLARDTLPELAERIHASCLVNEAPPGPYQLKVTCTYQDRAAFASVVGLAGDHFPLPPGEGQGEGKHLVFSPITDAYAVFKSALSSEVQKGLDLVRLEEILLRQLSFVAITLDSEDNPYRIFESLNAKGMPLTQGDLLRNYFFMRLP